MSAGSDSLNFLDESLPLAQAEFAPWRVLVVDDDPEVHQATIFALEGLSVLQRPLELLHAYSARECLEVLGRESDIAVILLDVVMESTNAGLEIVSRIREDLGLVNTRIILRTGQPGYAPEIDTIRRYDINDYKTKSEFTRAKLYVTLSSSLRTYDQLCREEARRKHLEQILQSSRLLRLRSEETELIEEALRLLTGYVGKTDGALVCRRETDGSGWRVIAASGSKAPASASLLDPLEHAHLLRLLEKSREQGTLVREPDGISVYLGGGSAAPLVACLNGVSGVMDAQDAQLLEVFCSNLAAESENRLLLNRLQSAAYTDVLTGLGNRTDLIRHVEGLMTGLPSSDPFMLALVDIDQFGSINDLFGHAYGDQLLCHVAKRLQQVLASECYIARVGSDTFALACKESLISLEDLRGKFEVPFSFDGVEHVVTVSMGAVRLRESASRNGADLLKEAWIALKRARLNGQSQVAYFSIASGEETREHTRLLHALRQAFRQDRLYLAYQPQVDLQTGSVMGVEALMRWRGEDGRFISPDRFLPIAESTGMIVELGAWVLGSSLRAAEALVKAGHVSLRMAVNVSAHQFSHVNFLADLDAALAASSFPAAKLELEITESIAVLGVDKVQQLLAQIRLRGILIAIDDFGTGYSSLSYLDQLPADRLKIDRSFISVLPSQTRTARIPEMLIPLGQQLGMSVLAEGVETQEQADYLRQLGCNEAQGYFYARPMALPELLQWLQGRDTTGT